MGRAIALGGWLLGCAAGSLAAGTPLTTVEVVGGLSRPVFVTAPPGDTSRIFIVEQRASGIGRIRIFNLASGLVTTPFFTIQVNTANEQGLLGLAFDPNYANNGFFYVNYTSGSGGGITTVARYRVLASNPSLADPASATTIITYAQPQNNHNGGWLGFGPDGYLYIASGDGGNRDDTGTGHTPDIGNAQDRTNLLGKMLRVDVRTDDFPDDPNRNYGIPDNNPFVEDAIENPEIRTEIWAYGLRNPWRNSFDRLTGDLWIGDVGQDAREEINFQPAGSSGGQNYGWRCKEGDVCTGFDLACDCESTTLTDPVFTYTHAVGCSVTGGVVYRGSNIWDLRGTYFCSDYCSSDIYTFRLIGGVATDIRNREEELDPPGMLLIQSVTSFGEDAAGELYICDQSGGQVFRVVASGPVIGDMNGDGSINFDDIEPFVLALISPAEYQTQFGFNPNLLGDTNLDNVLNFDDIESFIQLLIGS